MCFPACFTGISPSGEMWNRLVFRTFTQSFKPALKSVINTLQRGLQGHTVAFFVLPPNLFKSWQRVLLFKIVNFMTKPLVLGKTIGNSSVVQLFVQLSVIPQCLLLL